SVAVGKPPIEDQEVVGVEIHELVGFLHAGGLVAGEARAGQRADHQRAQARVVLEDQGAHQEARDSCFTGAIVGAAPARRQSATAKTRRRPEARRKTYAEMREIWRPSIEDSSRKRRLIVVPGGTGAERRSARLPRRLRVTAAAEDRHRG